MGPSRTGSPHLNSVILRTLTGLFATCVIAALLWWALTRADPAVQAARGLHGERWYQLTLAEQPVGYYRSLARRSATGSHEFHTELRFALSTDQPVTITESYIFAAGGKRELLRARHQVERTAGVETVHISRSEQGLQAQRSDGSGGAQAPAQPLDWQFTLADYLAFESWISATAPLPGSAVTVTSPNLDTLAMTSEAFELVSADANGYQVRKRSLLDDTVIELDRSLVPVRFQLAGVFTLERSTEQQALTARTALQKSSYRLPLSEPLQRPQELTRLELRVSGRSAAEFPQPLVLSANPIVPANDEDYLGASTDYPVHHPKLQRVLEGLNLAGLKPEQQVDRLLQHVHQFVTYDDSVVSRRVLDLLAQPSGDCTEFADLFTSLARAAGLPARTIIGMAYSADPEPALAFHAWNQVLVDGHWQAVDPTWNQRQIDATHWPLPSSERRAMLLLTGRVDVQLEVLEAAYGLQPQGAVI